MTESPFLDKKLLNVDKYLGKRGLIRSDFDKAQGLTLVPSTNHEWYRHFKFSMKDVYRRNAVFLMYLKPDGEPWLDNDVPYGVLRFVDEPVGEPPDTKVPKVLSQYGRRSELHFAPLSEGRSWNALQHGSRVVHLESLVKAECVSKHLGEACVGYNGVGGWQSTKQGAEQIHTVSGFAFDTVANVILFDSNVTTNDLVIRSMNKLAYMLRHVIGSQVVKIATLPKPDVGEWPEQDWGPDDFLMVRGADALKAVIDNAQAFQDEQYAELVEEINAKAVYVRSLACVLTREDKVIRSYRDAALHLAAVNRVEYKKGGRTEMVMGIEQWRVSKNRKEVDQPQYAYLEDEFFERDGLLYGNLYRKSGPWPIPRMDIPEKCLLGVKLLENMMSADDLRIFRAYIKFLKFTNHKPTSYLVLWSTKRGVGKGWAMKLAYKIIGEGNSTVAQADSLSATHNAHMVGHRLVNFNEFMVKKENRMAALNSLKNFIGDDIIHCRAMGRDSYPQYNTSGILISTNDRSEVPSDGLEDRRQAYMDCGHREPWSADSSDWEAVHKLLDDEEALLGLAEWFRQGEDVDFRSWRPPLTEQRIADLMTGRHPLEQLCSELREEFIEMGIKLCVMAQIKERAEAVGYDMGWYNPRTMAVHLRAAKWVAPKEYARVGSAKIQGWMPKEGEVVSVPNQEIQRAGMVLIGKEKFD